MTEDKQAFEKEGVWKVPLWRNSMSYLGILMTTAAAMLIGILLLIDLLADVHSAYLGVLVFFILPVFFMAGLLLVAWGMWDEHKRRRKTAVVEVPRFPILDLNIRGHQVRFIAFVGGTVFAALLLTVVAYEAYHFTESLTFCGELCHVVMHPEATASQNSPHARVSCAGCHVGPGAGWYVKSKLAGTRQMFAVLLRTYPKPIPPAIQHLRPARETCEECHWPEKFYGSKLKVWTHFAFDEHNTAHDVSFLTRIGGGESTTRGGGGIHWHMLNEHKVTFEAADPALQVIPVVWEDKGDGKIIEYRLQGYEEEEHGDDKGHGNGPREVDCVVCHNRPTHIYQSPHKAMDMAMAEGRVDATLPWIKRTGVEALVEEFSDQEQAKEQIEERVRGFYQENYPELVSSRGEDIDQAVETIQRIYSENFFPEMNVDWSKYPDNIGHWFFPGCFRCHDGKHVSEDGEVIRRDCEICHTMPQSTVSENWAEATYAEGKEWETWHPWDLKYQHGEMNCNRCHSGGLPPSQDCATCHEEKGVAQYDPDVGMGDFDCLDCHLDEQKVQPVMECMDCHDDIGELHVDIEDHLDAGCVTCHQPHLWVVDSRETCYECHDDKEDHNPGDLCSDCHDFI